MPLCGYLALGAEVASKGSVGRERLSVCIQTCHVIDVYEQREITKCNHMCSSESPSLTTSYQEANVNIFVVISAVIGASVSEPPLVDSTDALSCTIDIYIRPAPATAHARRYAQT